MLLVTSALTPSLLHTFSLALFNHHPSVCSFLQPPAHSPQYSTPQNTLSSPPYTSHLQLRTPITPSSTHTPRTKHLPHFQNTPTFSKKHTHISPTSNLSPKHLTLQASLSSSYSSRPHTHSSATSGRIPTLPSSTWKPHVTPGSPLRS